jgi:D-alanyl-D-alanine dipeptidase
MGTHFDFFDATSHWDSQEISKTALSNREILKKIMNEAGFE